MTDSPEHTPTKLMQLAAIRDQVLKPFRNYPLTMLSLCLWLNPAMLYAQPLSEEQYRAAVHFHEQHGYPMDIQLFDKKTSASQAMLLGSTLVLHNEDRDTAKQLLLDAADKPDQLTHVEYGYTLNMLGNLYQEEGGLDQAERFYRKAIGAKYEDACNNLGVMWERQQDFVKARKTYLGCLPELPSALLYLNLGTLYYNGLGTGRDPKTGGFYWQKSFDAFAYDPDINYNLGLYHLRYSRRFDQARYHLSLALALGDRTVMPMLAEYSVIGEYSDRRFADELRLESDPNRRRWLIQDRLRYTLENRYLDHTDDRGIAFTLSDDAERIQLTAPGHTADDIEQAVIRMLYLIYVDRLSPISLDLQRMTSDLIDKKKAALYRHHWKHQAHIDQAGTLHYEAYIP